MKWEKPFPLCEDWCWDVEEKWSFWDKHGVFGRVVKRGRQWIVTKDRGKTQKVLKIDLKKQNTRFSRLSQVASKSPKHLKHKFWKICLSVFRDWKFYPQGSREVSRKNLCVPLTTGTSNREQVAKLSREKR